MNISTICINPPSQYSVALLLLLIAHIALGALLLVKMNDLKEVMARLLSKFWDNRSTEADFWDFIQLNVSRLCHWIRLSSVHNFNINLLSK